jgi:hypothetical protein
MEEIKIENKNDNNNIIRNLLYLKPKYNIDLFTDLSEEKNENTKSIYLKYYNEHTRKTVLNKKGNNKVCSNRYYEKNLDIIKQKQIKNGKQKENEEKIKSQKKKEKHFEYRIKRMHKLYSSKNILNNNNNNIISRESKIKNKNKKSNDLIRSCSCNFPNKNIKKENNEIKKAKRNIKEVNDKKRKINLSFDDKSREECNETKLKNSARITNANEYKDTYKGVIVITQRKYNKKIKTMIKLSKIYEDELNSLKGDKKYNIEKEKDLNKLLICINDEIERYKHKINILVIE